MKLSRQIHAPAVLSCGKSHRYLVKEEVGCAFRVGLILLENTEICCPLRDTTY